MVIIGMDPPEHRNFRDVVARAFTPKRISTIEPTMRAETRAVFSQLAQQDSCDFVADVAAIIPMWSISELVGVPVADRHRLYELSHSLIDDQDPEVAPTPETAMEAVAEIFAYASEMAQRARLNPEDNLTGDLLSAQVNGRKLDDLEFTLFFVFLIVAGNETTRTATSHGLLALLEHPEQFELLRQDPSLIPAAVEEILRWQPPIHHFRRTATCDVKVGGQQIAQGDKVIMFYAGANRDPAVFPDRHRFDITRSPNRQLSFGVLRFASAGVVVVVVAVVIVVAVVAVACAQGARVVAVARAQGARVGAIVGAIVTLRRHVILVLARLAHDGGARLLGLLLG
jgi:cholest-4-en-3-one 26-monooxygenase